MLDMHKIQELAFFCQRNDIHLLALQEHRITHSATIETHTITCNGAKWNLLTSSAHTANNTVTGGIGLLVSLHLHSTLVEVKPVTSPQHPHARILSSIFRINKIDIHCLTVYAPHASSAHADRHTFLATLSAQLHRRHTIVLGDFNAIVRPSQQYPYGYTDPLSADTQVASEDLEDLLNEHDLVNHSNRVHYPNFYTFQSPDLKRRVPIDHIITTQALTSAAPPPLRSNRAPIPTDHRLVISAMNLHLHVHPQRSPRPDPPEITLLRTSRKDIQSFVQTYRAHFAPDATNRCRAFIAACTAALNTLPRRKRTTRTNIMTHPEVQAARQLVEAAPLNALRAEFKRLCTTKKQLIDEDIESFCALFATHANSDSRFAYEALRAISRKPAPTGKIEGDSPEARLELVRAYCAAQLQNPIGNRHLRFKRPVRGLAFAAGEITTEELSAALRKLDNHKAPGPDGIPNEVLKLPELQSDIHIIMNECLSTSILPPDILITKFVTIPKSGGNLRTPAGWRYIALMSTLTKLYDRVLLNRIAEITRSYLRNAQNGFLPHRNTIQHATALALIIEDHKTRRTKPLFVVYIDFSNAFPSITRTAIAAALLAFGVPLILRQAVMAVYNNHQAYVSTNDGDTATFTPTAGVLQGDTLAPYLFVMVLDLILRKALDAAKYTDAPPTAGIRDLDFADDIALLASNQADAQLMIDRIRRYALRAGLAINVKKTMYQYIGDGPPPVLTCAGIPLVHVTSYRYLGVYTDVDQDIRARTGQAWTTVRSLNKIWRSQSLTTPNKVLLFKTLILPILLYGATTYPLTERRQNRLQGTQTKMLRWIRGYYRGCCAPLKVILAGCPHIVALILDRATNLLSTTALRLPNHPLLQVLAAQPDGKLKAGRYHLLRTQLHDLQPMTNTPQQERIRYWEAELYQRVQRTRDKAHLVQHMAANTAAIPANDDEEDTPLADLNRYKMHSIRSVTARYEYLLLQGLLPPFVAISSPAEDDIAPDIPTDTPLTFTLVTALTNGFFWTTAACSEDPQLSRVVVTRERPHFSRTDALQAVINDCLREHANRDLRFLSILADRVAAPPRPITHDETETDHPPPSAATTAEPPTRHPLPVPTLATDAPRKHVIFKLRSLFLLLRTKKKRITTFATVPKEHQLNHPNFVYARTLLLKMLPQTTPHIY